MPYDGVHIDWREARYQSLYLLMEGKSHRTIPIYGKLRKSVWVLVTHPIAGYQV